MYLKIEKKLKAYKDQVDKEHLKLAKDFYKYQEKTVEHLKKFL